MATKEENEGKVPFYRCSLCKNGRCTYKGPDRPSAFRDGWPKNMTCGENGTVDRQDMIYCDKKEIETVYIYPEM